MIAVPSWYTRSVSRETCDALDHYAALLRKWTGKINLISQATLETLEIRHIWDSAQIYTAQPGKWLDIGSGGGLPGVIVSILRKGDGLGDEVILVESDQRKCAFLRTCARELDLKMTILAERVEAVDPASASVLSARALAPLTDLMAHAERHLHGDGLAIFQKGASWRSEIASAEQQWRFSYAVIDSKTHSDAVTLEVRDIQRV